MDGSTAKKHRIDVDDFLKKTGSTRHKFSIEAGVNPATLNRYANGETWSEDTHRKIEEAQERIRKAIAESQALTKVFLGNKARDKLPKPPIAPPTDEPVMVTVGSVDGDETRRQLVLFQGGQMIFTYIVDEILARRLGAACNEITVALSRHRGSP